MAESETILRLGIEAAREGNREEARNLFSLLTRQEPDNVQAWLWLAGVAEGPDQRRAALERVLELEPDNEMALKGLQAMGVTPPARATDTSEAAAVAAGAAAGAAAATAAPSRPMTEEELFAAELDSAFDLADELPRATPPPRREEETAEAAAAGAAAGTAAALEEDRRRYRPSSARMAADLDDDDDTVPARSGPSLLLWVLVALVILALLAYLLWQLFGGQGPETAQPTAAPAPTVAAETPAGATPDTGATTAPGAETPAATEDPNAQPTEDVSAQPTAEPGAPDGEMPTAETGEEPAAPTSVPVTGADPLPIPPNSFISANGWNYTWPGTNVCAFGCAVVLGPQVGSFTAQGTFVHVLAFVQNTTGTDQPLPADFFVLRDSQGRVYEARADVAEAAWRPGSADVPATGSIPANGATTSVYLVFDVAPDAQNLVMFSRHFTDQGWPVLASVQ